MLGGLFGLFFAWVLSWFNFDVLVIKGMEELFGRSISMSGYYLLFFFLGIFLSIFSSVKITSKSK